MRLPISYAEYRRPIDVLNVLYLLNFAGKAGTERYVETLVKYLNHKHIRAFSPTTRGACWWSGWKRQASPSGRST